MPSASSADSAGTANSAGNAISVGGVTIKKFHYRTAAASAAQQPVLSLGGLTLTATCGVDGPEVVATASVSDAILHS